MRFRPELFRQFIQPLLNAILLDFREPLAIDTRRAAVTSAAVVGNS